MTWLVFALVAAVDFLKAVSGDVQGTFIIAGSVIAFL
jgi:hypothetical protein